MEKQSTRKFLKLFVALVALFLLGSSALLLSSCKEEHTHDWGEGTVSVQPTCTAQGLKTFECSCGAVRTEPIQATGHKWEQEGEPVEPTCKDEGYTLYKCSVCGETEQRDVKPTTKHDFQLVEEVAPTCTKDGAEVYECSYCGTVYQKTIAASGEHEYDKEHPYLVVEANCIAGGYIQYRCTKCGEIWTDPTSYTPIGTHNYQVVEDESHPATCTESGLKIYECEFCGDRYTDSQYTADNPATGHKWKENTDAEETEFWGITVDATKGFTVKTNNGEEITYQTVADAKKDGWTVSKEAMCNTDGTLTRVCDRCQTTETVTIKAPGHKIADADKATHFVCLAQKDLTDVNGKQYAFECANGDHCDAKVVIDAAGTTAHYVAPVAHTLGNYTASTDKDHPAATCEEEGYEQATCSVCKYVDYKEVAALEHNYNTVQFGENGGAVVACETDKVLSDTELDSKTGLQKGLMAYLDFMKESVGDAEYQENYSTYVNNWTALIVTGKKTASRVCARCGEIDEATGHEWVIGTLEEGKFELTDYMKNEDGTPVVAEGVTVDTMTCRNVRVCANGCGSVASQGDHGTITAATCREDGKCTICGEPDDPQTAHNYVAVANILDKTNYKDTVEVKSTASDEGAQPAAVKYNGKTLTYGDLRAAYEKIKSDVSGIVPVTATCTTGGTEVWVCAKCVMDAANGTEFTWNAGTATDKAPTDAVGQYSYYTKAVTAGHDYEAHYYRLSSTGIGVEEITWAQTNCTFGYKVAYICADCDTPYKNVPVANSTADPDAANDNKAEDITVDGVKVSNAYTDSNGFVLNQPATGTAWNQITSVPAVNDHRGTHSVYVPTDYDDYSAGRYAPANCVEGATLPVVCENCGCNTLSYSAADLKAEAAASEKGQNGFVLAQKPSTNANKNAIYVETATFEASGDLANFDQPDLTNHKEATFACDTHCKAVDEEGNFVCGVLVNYVNTEESLTEGNVITSVDPDGTYKDYATDGAHASTDVTLTLHKDVKYLDSYTLKVAEVKDDMIVESEGESGKVYNIDWTKATLADTDKASVCAGDTGYTLPMNAPAANASDKPAAGTYLVLVDADGKIYALNNLNFYADSTGEAKDNILAAGSKQDVQMSDTYFVRLGALVSGEFKPAYPAGVPVVATTVESLVYALEAQPTPSADGKTKTLTINVAANITIAATDTTFGEALATAGRNGTTHYVVNLNGYTMTYSGELTDAFAINDNVVFNNGTLVFKDATNGALTFGAKAIDVAFNNVTINVEKGNGIKLVPDATAQAAVSFTNSTINVTNGTYGIYTSGNGSSTTYPGNTTATKAALTLTNTKVNVFPTAENAKADTTALYLDIPAVVDVVGGELVGTYQAVVVHAGVLNVKSGAKLIVKSELSVEDKTVVSDNAGDGQVAFSALGNVTNTEATMTQAMYGYTLQQYRLSGLWGDAVNGLPRAAVVVGNSDFTKYNNYTVKATFADDTLFTAGSYPAIVIGGNYVSGKGTATEAPDTPDLADAKVTVITSAACTVCDNFDVETVAFGGSEQSLKFYAGTTK